MLSIGPFPAAVPGEKAPVVLRRQSFVTGTNSSTRVRLPTPAKLLLRARGSSPATAFHADGPLTALVLLEEGASSPSGAAVVQYRKCSGDACDGKRAHRFAFPLGSANPDLRLKAGVYRLYLVSQTGPARVELGLAGLSGRTRLVLDEPADATVTHPTVRLSAGPFGNVYSVGDSDSVEGDGLAVSLLWLETSIGSIRATGTCVWEGSPPVPQEVAYAPGCGRVGANESGHESGAFPPGGNGGTVVTDALMFSRGTWGLGHYVVTPERVDGYGSSQLWLVD